MHQLGILLAAGYGRRFQIQQPSANKLLVQLSNGQTVAASSLNNLRHAVDQVVVVIRPNSPQLYAELFQPYCLVVESEHAQHGMGASLADAARFILHHYPAGTVKHVLVALADMPYIPHSCFDVVQQAVDTFPIAAPCYRGQRGHPVGFQGHLLPELARLSGDEGARSLINQHGIELISCNEAGVCFDIDAPDDLRQPFLNSALRSH